MDTTPCLDSCKSSNSFIGGDDLKAVFLSYRGRSFESSFIIVGDVLKAVFIGGDVLKAEQELVLARTFHCFQNPVPPTKGFDSSSSPTSSSFKTKQDIPCRQKSMQRGFENVEKFGFNQISLI